MSDGMSFALAILAVAIMIALLIRIVCEREYRNSKFLDEMCRLEKEGEVIDGQRVHDETTELSNRETDEFKDNEDDDEIVPREIVDKLISSFNLD